MMRDYSLNWPLRIGVFLIGVLLGINHFIELPDFIFGFGLGLGLVLDLAGVYALHHDINKVRALKKRIFHAIVG